MVTSAPTKLHNVILVYVRGGGERGAGERNKQLFLEAAFDRRAGAKRARESARPAKAHTNAGSLVFERGSSQDGRLTARPAAWYREVLPTRADDPDDLVWWRWSSLFVRRSARCRKTPGDATTER